MPRAIKMDQQVSPEGCLWNGNARFFHATGMTIISWRLWKFSLSQMSWVVVWLNWRWILFLSNVNCYFLCLFLVPQEVGQSSQAWWLSTAFRSRHVDECARFQKQPQQLSISFDFGRGRVQPHQGRVRVAEVSFFLRPLMSTVAMPRGLELAFLRLFQPLWKVHRQKKASRGQNIRVSPTECHKLKKKSKCVLLQWHFSSFRLNPRCILTLFYSFFQRCWSYVHIHP